MTTTLPPLAPVDARPLPTMTDPGWDRPLVPALIAAGMDLAAFCGCGSKLIDHDGPLIDFLYGSLACWEASAYTAGDR